VKFKQFCHGEPWNFVNWPVEFGTICRGKLWAPLICSGLHEESVRNDDRLTRGCVTGSWH